MFIVLLHEQQATYNNNNIVNIDADGFFIIYLLHAMKLILLIVPMSHNMLYVFFF